MTDIQLLEQYRGGSDEAFADLVRRHVGWIYGVACRGLRDSHQAQDVVQAVFVLLHRKSPRFQRDRQMIAWLHRAAWYATQVAVRGRQRRAKHEKEAAMLRSEAASREENVEWRQLAPVLDELIASLSREDREAILLRYYRQMTFAEVAAEMGSTEEAVRKRIERAIEKLRRRATGKGLIIPAAAIAIALQGKVALAAPPGLAATATGAALAAQGSAVAASGIPIAQGALTMMTFAKIKIAAAVLMGMITVAGTAALVYAATASSQSASTRPTSRPALKKDYPRLSPFSAILWHGDVPQVQVEGTWYELLALDDLETAKIVEFCHRTYGDRWQKRFDEDLVEVLFVMGQKPGLSVRLRVRLIGGNDVSELADVMMTEANRQMIWRARNEGKR